jgi:hypothetical protein
MGRVLPKRPWAQTVKITVWEDGLRRAEQAQGTLPMILASATNAITKPN